MRAKLSPLKPFSDSIFLHVGGSVCTLYPSLASSLQAQLVFPRFRSSSLKQMSLKMFPLNRWLPPHPFLEILFVVPTGVTYFPLSFCDMYNSFYST